MRHMCIDYGLRRVGVALSDENGKVAFPHCILDNDRFLLEKLIACVADERVGCIVLGESRDEKGGENPLMSSIHSLQNQLEMELDVPILYEQEPLTSAHAREFAPRGTHIDDSAAALILQRYLDRKEFEAHTRWL